MLRGLWGHVCRPTGVSAPPLHSTNGRFYKEVKEEHHTTTYKRVNGETLQLQLVGKHSLWGHFLWVRSITHSNQPLENAGVVMADYLDSPECSLKNKRVLELGAGAALPSLVCLLRGAAFACITDYPEIGMSNLHLGFTSRRTVEKHPTQREERSSSTITELLQHSWVSVGF